MCVLADHAVRLLFSPGWNHASAIAKRLGYISVTDVLKVVTDETSVEVFPIPPCTPTSDTHSLQDAQGVPRKWSMFWVLSSEEATPKN